MALIARYLIDISAAPRMRHRGVAQRITPLIEAGVVATTAARDAEALYNTRGPAEYEQLWEDRRAAYEYVPTNDKHSQAALGAQRQLARTGHHRCVGVADLLTAVLAAEHRVTVVHYDADFDTAAKVLAFAHQWVVPRDSL